jgi:hypothetical protein
MTVLPEIKMVREMTKTIERRQKAINEAFLVTLTRVLVSVPRMNAAESLLHSLEKARLLAPTMGRQQSEGYRPAFAYCASACSLASSSALRARSKTATPPIQPVKPTPRELWMTRPMVKGPPVPSSLGS